MFQVRQKSTPTSVSGASDILMSSRLLAFGTCIPLLRCKSVEPKKSRCLPTSFPSALIRRNEEVQTEFLGPFMSREPLVRPWSKERLSIIVNLLSSEWHNLIMLTYHRCTHHPQVLWWRARLVLQGKLAADHLSKKGSRINVKEKLPNAQQTQGINFIKRLNLGHTTGWFCLAKRNILSNPCNNFNKYV